MAKKGIWVSEFRIESGLNCGGHAFPTQGLLLGPILNEFKNNRRALSEELFELCKPVWIKRGIASIEIAPNLSVTVQGGIGTPEEQKFLINKYSLESTGWGTPFLLVPEATTVDEITLGKLMAAKSEDLYLSKSSPLGVPFNNLKSTDSENTREVRINKDKPGSPCLKQYLVSNTEFTKEPICTASRQYQHLKIKELETKNLSKDLYNKTYEDIVVKACLCEDLAAPAYTNNKLTPKIKASTAICPGPNLAFFSRKYSLMEMVDHIYGNGTLLSSSNRPHVFINELKLYIDYLENESKEMMQNFSAKQHKYLESFKGNLERGVRYYESLIPEISLDSFKSDLKNLGTRLSLMLLPEPHSKLEAHRT